VNKIIAAVISVGFVLAAPAWADRADRAKPLNLSANAYSGNLEVGESTWDGNFVAEQGSMLIRADRATIRRDKDGSISVVATGGPVNYREKRENSEDYINAFAERVEYDERAGTIKLINQARIQSSDGELRGDVILYNSLTGAYQVQSGGKSGDATNRVRAVILPRAQAAERARESAAAPPAALKVDPTPPSVPAAPAKR
jgi:lipopolysaccharide export system protein LptA